MALLDMLDPQRAPTGKGIQMDSQSVWDVAGAAWTATRDNYNSESRDRLVGKHWGNSLKIYENMSGISLEDELAEQISEAQKVNLGLSPRDIPSERESNIQIRNRIMSDKIKELKESDPEKYADLLTYGDAVNMAREEAKQSLIQQSAVSKYASPTGSLAGNLLGSLGGALTDPINVVTMPFGASVSKSILKAMAVEAGIGVGAEIAIQPKVAQWQRDIGNEYGINEVVESIALAGAGAAGLTGAIGASLKGIRLATPMASEFFNKLGNNADLPLDVRTSAKYMEVVAQFEEANPHIESPTAYFKKHNEAVNVTQRALLREDRPLLPDELPIKQVEFDEISTRPREGMTEGQVQRLEDLERFQSEARPEPIMRNESIEIRDLDTQKQEAVDLARSNPDLTPDEKRIIQPGAFEEASVVSFDGQTGIARLNDGSRVPFDLASVTQESYRGMTAGQKAGAEPPALMNGQKVLIREMGGAVDNVYPLTRRQTVDSDVDNLAAGESIPENSPQAMAIAKPEKELDFEIEMAAFKSRNDSNAIQAEQTEFNRLLEEFGDDPAFQNIEMEDGRTMSLRQLAEEFESDQRFVDAMSACAIG